METIVVGAALAGSFATAFLIQKAVLAAFFRAMDADRRTRRP